MPEMLYRIVKSVPITLAKVPGEALRGSLATHPTYEMRKGKTIPWHQGLRLQNSANNNNNIIIIIIIKNHVLQIILVTIICDYDDHQKDYGIKCDEKNDIICHPRQDRSVSIVDNCIW